MSGIPEFGTPRENEERRDGGAAVAFDPETGLFAVGKERVSGLLRLFGGGVEDGEDMQEGVLRELREESGLHDFAQVEFVGEALAHYHNGLKKVNRVAHARCYLVILKSTSVRPVQLEEHETFDLVWVTAQDILNDWHARNDDNGLDHWLYFLTNARAKILELGYRIRE